ncbi:MAG: class I SAM-dependent methyltransferase, partial [Kiritimatiellia bacterium]|nr:class I SAM-dependent methyltransferase [Kiritimatiellia bacterium]
GVKPGDDSMGPDDYELLDSGDQKKLERFGSIVLSRPCAQAVWRPELEESVWSAADATFDREEGNRWQGQNRLPKEWTVRIEGIQFKLSGTDFGHLGVFPEQRAQWRWIGERIGTAGSRPSPLRILNLFAYSGGSTLAALRGGAEVCHLDASHGMVDWARENAALNGWQERPVRWIVDDAIKFLAREERRGKRYDAIILDPPSFGRGKSGELFKIERDLPGMMDACERLLSDDPAFILLSAHTPGFSPMVLENLLRQRFANRSGRVESGEMQLTGSTTVLPLPNGAYARWMSGA